MVTGDVVECLTRMCTASRVACAGPTDTAPGRDSVDANAHAVVADERADPLLDRVRRVGVGRAFLTKDASAEKLRLWAAC